MNLAIEGQFYLERRSDMGNIDSVCWWIAAFLYYFGSIYAGYVVGFKNGFNKSKEIDDKIIEELSEKYKEKR